LPDRFADIVNVKDFGAVGDGTTDDTAAIQAAIDSLSPFNPFVTDGGEVYIPRGRYRLTASIDLTGKHGISISGAGVLATELFSTGNFPVISSVNTDSLPWNDGQIRNLTIRGGGNGNANAHGIYTLFTNGCSIDNIAIYSCKYGLNINHAWQYNIQNVDMHGGGSDKCDIGVYMGATTATNIDNAITANNITVKDCLTSGFRIINGQGSKFVNCEAGAVPIGWHIGEPPSGTVPCKWLHIINCLADTTTDAGWKIVKGNASELSEMAFTNCWSGNNTAVGANGLVYIDGMQDSLFSAWQLNGCTNSAVQILNSSKIIFSSFVLERFNGSNLSKHGFILNNSSRCSIDGVVTPLNSFTNSDANEIGTSDSNVLRISNSNGASIIGANSRHYANETLVKAGTSFALSFKANAGSSVISLENGNAKIFNLASRNDDYFSIADGATARILIEPTNGHVIAGTDNTQRLGSTANRWSTLFANSLQIGSGPTISTGSGSPEGVVTAAVGSLYTNGGGSTSTTLYVKTSGSGNTGWTAK
jgi:hypothetical protein